MSTRLSTGLALLSPDSGGIWVKFYHSELTRNALFDAFYQRFDTDLAQLAPLSASPLYFI